MEEKCYICGTESGEAVLFDAVVEDGIVKICEKCSSRENIPLIKSGQSVDIDADKGKSNYERLSKMAGLDPNDHKSKFGPEKGQDSKEKEKHSKEVKKSLEEKNDLSFPDLNQLQPEQKDDLIRNFHWSVLRARRAQGHTYKSLGENISEDEQSIRMAERGVLPENYHAFIRKLQLALGITLFKKPDKVKAPASEQTPAQSTTISDLQERHKQMNQSGENNEQFEEDQEPLEEESIKTPLWRRVLNLFKSRKNNKYSEGPFEVPEDEVEEDLNLARAQELGQNNENSKKDNSVEHPQKSSKEKVKASLKGLKSLRMRRKQREEDSIGTSPRAEEESKKNYHDKRIEHAKKSEKEDHVSSGSYSSNDDPSENSPRNDNSKDAQPKDKTEEENNSSEAENKKGDDGELSEDEINRIAFGGK